MLNLRAVTVGKNTYLQQLEDTPPAHFPLHSSLSYRAEYTTLRPICPLLPDGGINTDPDQCIFIVGTPSAHTAYTLRSLVLHSRLNSLTHAARDSDDMDYFGLDFSCTTYDDPNPPHLPLLPSASLPPMLSSDLSDMQYEALILRMLGLPTKHLTEETREAVSSTLHSLNYTLVPPAHISPLLTAAGWGTANQTNNTQPDDTQDLTQPDDLLSPTQPDDTQPTFAITQLTDDEKRAFLRSVNRRNEVAPRSWPWKDMEVWDKTVVPPTLAVRAQRAAHAYAAASGKVFKTKRLADGSLQVTRIDGHKEVKRMVG